MIKITIVDDWGFQMRMNIIKITTMKLGPYFMTITKWKTTMKRRTEPTFECLGNEDHDEDLLHTITITCTTQSKTNIKKIQQKKQIHSKYL